MDEVGSPARRRCGPAGLSAVQSDTIEGLTELEDLERVYAQLCAEEVNMYMWRHSVRQSLCAGLREYKRSLAVLGIGCISV